MSNLPEHLPGDLPIQPVWNYPGAYGALAVTLRLYLDGAIGTKLLLDKFVRLETQHDEWLAQQGIAPNLRVGPVLPLPQPGAPEAAPETPGD